MRYAILLIAGTGLMLLLDRVMWRHAFLYFSIGANKDRWISGEDRAQYRYADSVKLVILALFTGSVMLAASSTRWGPVGIALIFATGAVWLYYTLRAANAAFKRGLTTSRHGDGPENA